MLVSSAIEQCGEAIAPDRTRRCPSAASGGMRAATACSISVLLGSANGESAVWRRAARVRASP